MTNRVGFSWLLRSTLLLALCGWPLVGCGDDSGTQFAPMGGTGGGNSGNGNRDAGGDGDGDGDTGGGDGDTGGDGDGDTGGGDGDTGGGDGDITPVDTPDSPTNPWIAFIQIDGSGFGQLFFVKADGTGMHEYGGDSFSEDSPSWAPDGDRLAFTTGSELRILDFTDDSEDNVDVGDLEKLTRPRWLDDDTIIVSGNLPDEKSALFKIDIGGGGATKMTSSTAGDAGHDVGPNDRIYFVRNDGGFEVFWVPSDATPSDSATKVTTGSSILASVTVHPDGTKLLYAADDGGSSTDLTEYDIAAGSKRVIGDKGDEQGQYFSGGDGIVVNRDSFNAFSEIATTDVNGALIMQVTDDMSLNTSPSINSKESDGMDPTVF